jgi:hypothetical protein
VGLGVAILDAFVGLRRPVAGDGRGLGDEVDVFALASGAFGEGAGDDTFAAAVAVAGGGVDQVDAEVERLVEGGEGVAVVLRAPGAAAEGPGAEADFRDFPAEAAEGAIVHARCEVK